VNDFVEHCRREWKRLRVPDAVADEMAAELAADLQEAAAEGASPEEVLGSGASDPRSFAASWAAERAVIPPTPLTVRLRRSLIQPATAVLTIVAATGAALVIFASPNAPVSKAVVGPAKPRLTPRHSRSADTSLSGLRRRTTVSCPRLCRRVARACRLTRSARSC
jgi:hypothetical protein